MLEAKDKDMVFKQKKSIDRRWFLKTFVVRLIILILVIIFSNALGTDLNPAASNPDDRRYEAGAIYYAEAANRLIDEDAFTAAYTSLGDPVGYHLFNWFEYTPLWYWVVCILVYIFKTIWSVRIFNIILASLTTVYIYKFCCLIGAERMATKAANLFAFLPYPVIFSCFAYKDQFVMLCFMYLLYRSTQIREQKIQRDRMIGVIVKMCVVALIMLFMRGGVGAVFCLVIVANAIGMNKIVGERGVRSRYILALVPVIIIGAVILAKSYSLIWYKLSHYLIGRGDTLSGTTISFLTVNSLKDIYKLPFAYIFSVVMPIGMFNGIHSWYDILSNVNVIMTPIAIGATLYIFKRNKADNFIYWCMMFIYLISIIASINIFRHYYSLLPLTLIAYSDFSVKATANQKLILLVDSVAMMLMLVLFYAL